MKQLILVGNQKVKFQDTETTISLTLVSDGNTVTIDSTKTYSVKIKNGTGYVKAINATPDTTNNMVTFSTAGFDGLPVDAYFLELWVIDTNGQTIYPSDSFIELDITANATGVQGQVVPAITLQEFEDRFSTLQSDLEAKVGTLIGPTGATGNGVSGVSTQYQLGTDGVNVPTGTWSDTPSTPTDTLPYMWTRNVTTYTDKSTHTSYNISAKGTKGNNFTIQGSTSSIAGLPSTGTDGEGYMVGTELYVWTNGKWNDIVNMKGVQGDQGIQGIQGVKGDTGTGISSITTEYELSKQGTAVPSTGWSSTLLTMTNDLPYLWTRVTITFTDGSKNMVYFTSSKGDKGDTGEKGDKGDTGANLAVKGAVDKNTQLPSSGNAEGDAYLVGTDLYVYTNKAWKNCGPIVAENTVLYNADGSLNVNGTNYNYVQDLRNGKIQYNDGTKNIELTPVDSQQEAKDILSACNYTDSSISSLSTSIDTKLSGYATNSQLATKADDSKVVHTTDTANWQKVKVTDDNGNLYSQLLKDSSSSWESSNGGWSTPVRTISLTAGVDYFISAEFKCSGGDKSGIELQLAGIPGTNTATIPTVYGTSIIGSSIKGLVPCGAQGFLYIGPFTPTITGTYHIGGGMENSSNTGYWRKITVTQSNIYVPWETAMANSISPIDNQDGTEQLNGVKVQPFNKLSDTIGGRNLLLDSKTQMMKTSWLSQNSGWTEDWGTYLGSNICRTNLAWVNVRYSYKDLLDRGVINTTDDFTYSIYFRVVGEDPAGMSYAAVRFYSTATTKNVTIMPLTSLKEGQWTRLVVPLKFNDFEYDPTKAYDYSIRVEMSAAPKVDGAHYEFAAPKLEKGSVATDWSPAPEDKVNVADMRTPASNVAGIEEVNAKADDSKVAHLSGANNFDTTPTVNNTPLLTSDKLPDNIVKQGDAIGNINYVMYLASYPTTVGQLVVADGTVDSTKTKFITTTNSYPVPTNVTSMIWETPKINMPLLVGNVIAFYDSSGNFISANAYDATTPYQLINFPKNAYSFKLSCGSNSLNSVKLFSGSSYIDSSPYPIVMGVRIKDKMAATVDDVSAATANMADTTKLSNFTAGLQSNGTAVATQTDLSTGLATKADDSKVVHTFDMRKPASDVAGIEEVNAKADNSKVAHLSGANNFDTLPTVNNDPLVTANQTGDVSKLLTRDKSNYVNSINELASIVDRFYPVASQAIPTDNISYSNQGLVYNYDPSKNTVTFRKNDSSYSINYDTSVVGTNFTENAGGAAPLGGIRIYFGFKAIHYINGTEGTLSDINYYVWNPNDSSTVKSGELGLLKGIPYYLTSENFNVGSNYTIDFSGNGMNLSTSGNNRISPRLIISNKGNGVLNITPYHGEDFKDDKSEGYWIYPYITKMVSYSVDTTAMKALPNGYSYAYVKDTSPSSTGNYLTAWGQGSYQYKFDLNNLGNGYSIDSMGSSITIKVSIKGNSSTGSNSAIFDGYTSSQFPSNTFTTNNGTSSGSTVGSLGSSYISLVWKLSKEDILASSYTAYYQTVSNGSSLSIFYAIKLVINNDNTISIYAIAPFAYNGTTNYDPSEHLSLGKSFSSITTMSIVNNV